MRCKDAGGLRSGYTTRKDASRTRYRVRHSSVCSCVQPRYLAIADPQVLRPAQYTPCWRDYTRTSIFQTSSVLL